METVSGWLATTSMPMREVRLEREGRSGGRKWDAVAAEVVARIEAGRYRRGAPLPSAGQLCQEFRVTHPTLRLAMGHLVRSGILEAQARGWRVRPPGSTISGWRIGYLRRCREDGTPFEEADRERFLRRALELEAGSQGLRIESWGISETGRVFRGSKPWQGGWGEALGGLVVSLWHLEQPGQVLSWLAGVDLPVAVWDERATEEPIAILPTVRWFSSGLGTESGIQVVRHLVEQGHRSISWISPFQASVWSRNRLDGCRMACREALVGMRLAEQVRDDRWDPAQFSPGQEQLDRGIEPLLQACGPAAARWDEQVRASASALLRDRALLECLDPLFEAALRDRGATAWICANDDIARLAWGRIEAAGLEVGTDIGLVGFDNTLWAQSVGLSSVGFREEELAKAMVAFLVSPRSPRPFPSLRLEGSVVVRSSSARRLVEGRRKG